MNTYGISWKSGKLSNVHKIEAEKKPTLSEAKRLLEKYQDGVLSHEISSKDSLLAYAMRYAGVNTRNMEILSVFRLIKDRSEISDEADAKTKEKIQKLLQLSMSDNKNEAELASKKAYQLMMKNSITREDLEGQEFLCFEKETIGETVRRWESVLGKTISEISGVYFVFSKKLKGNDRLAPMSAKLIFMGKERDVLNAVYLYENYQRIIENKVKETKKNLGLTTIQANDYRLGLIEGVRIKLEKEKNRFFTQSENEFYNMVSVDTRVKEAENLILAKTRKANSHIRDEDNFHKGYKEGKEINISQGVDSKRSDKFIAYNK